jgi:ubiquinone/menaquinone biosynthesis C-methylase UbiE
MTQRSVSGNSIAQAAARARIEEMAMQSAKQAARQAWALGDYHTFATELVWEVGPALVDSCGIGPGQRVLDVAAGTGNVAIRAAEAGATVIASDLTPENFAAGRREAASHGVEVEWVEADAEALPFADAEFDVVTSSFGAMFAPDHQRVADEIVRVCRPGGTIGMANFTPEGLAGEFFGLFAEYAPPPPPGALPPVLWGSEQHVRELFRDRVASLELTRRTYVERAASPAAYVELFVTCFGPIVALRAELGERAADFDRDFVEFAERANRGPADGQAEYPYEYLLVVARTAGA